MGIAGDDGKTPIDPNESEGLIPALATQDELNEFEALNILEGLAWSLRRDNQAKLFKDQESLKRLHRAMFSKTWRWAGTFRKSEKSVGVEAWRVSTEVATLIDDLDYWTMHHTFEPQEIAARVHHRLTWIHPFPNGNGRFARLAVDILCDREIWQLPSWGSTASATVDDIRRTYIKALRSADRSDFKPLIDFMFGI